ncbi:MAG: redox-regulated ATPase YchF, partial [Actinobacteria bacterium]|nr:redox-regulated ATPase YchF [Actinomycetota bacterium]
MSLSIGIVGLPNVGKSTLFTALTRKTGLAANYPFATIDPNVGVVPVPDARLAALAKIVQPQEVVPATVEFVDIAGLVQGASEGEGLGNRFLAHIRETDAICEVVRHFTDPDVIHVDGRVDPITDAEVIKMELVLADVATTEKALVRLEKEAKKDKALLGMVELIRRLSAWLDSGMPARTLEMTAEERESIRDLHLLTAKPHLYVANVDESALGDTIAPIGGVTPIAICGKVEAELAEMDAETATEYLEAIGLS